MYGQVQPSKIQSLTYEFKKKNTWCTCWSFSIAAFRHSIGSFSMCSNILKKSTELYYFEESVDNVRELSIKG